MLGTKNIRSRALIYSPGATFDLRDDRDGRGVKIFNWVPGSNGNPEPTQEQLEAISVPSVGTRLQTRLTAYLARTNDDAILFRALVNVMADQLGVSRTAARNAILAEAKTLLDG